MLAARLPALLLLALGTAAPAWAADPDVLTLTSGEQLVGELVDVRDGRYWILLADGRMVNVDFRLVTLVEMGSHDDAAPVAPGDLPLPAWSESPPDERPFLGGGFDVGLWTGGRLRFRVQTPLIAHVDLRLGVSPAVAPGLGLAILTGMDVAFPEKSPVRFTLGGSVGTATFYGDFYPFVSGGPGLQIDPDGPFEIHVGFGIGTTFSQGVTIVPDISVGWVW